MIPVKQAIQHISEGTFPKRTEVIPLHQALGRILQDTVLADQDQPPFNRSAMDGYAVRSIELNSWKIAATSLPGTHVDLLPELVLDECLRVFTGAPLPANIVKVIPQEQVLVKDGQITWQDRVGLGPDFIRRRGEDAPKGAVLLRPGRPLGPVELSIAASVGLGEMCVSMRPKVLHITSGDELVDPSAQPGPGQIRDSNSALIRALVLMAGGEMISQHRVGDHPEELINAALGEKTEPDLLLISGGASVGDHDHTALVLESLGYEIVFRKVDVRPGKPLIFARKGERYAFGIPGNPVSHFVVFHLFIRVLMDQLSGLEKEGEGELHEGFLGVALERGVKNDRETYWPACVKEVGGRLELYPLQWNSSGHLSSLMGANALIRIPPNSVSFSAGSRLAWVKLSS